MKRSMIVMLAAGALLLPGGVAGADHTPTNVQPTASFVSDVPAMKFGDIRWAANAQAAHGVAAPLGEGGPFTRGGRRYFAATSQTPGLTVVDVTDPLRPTPVSMYGAALGCPTAAGEYVGANPPSLDPANPRGTLVGAFFLMLAASSGWENDSSVTPDGRIALIGVDAGGRCHDPTAGGIELVDLTDLKNPRALHLLRLKGDSHSITIDPARPWLAYNSTSDGDDFVDIIDFKSCLGGVAKIDECRPTVARAVFSREFFPQIPLSDPKDPTKGDRIGEGCHDIRFLRDRAYCAAIDTTLILDTSGVIGSDGDLTGTHLTSGPNACRIVDATRAPGVKVTDCYGWTEEAFETRGARPAGLDLVSFVTHDGSKPATEDIEISHQAEPIEDGKILVVTDERGGGLGFGPDDGCPGGGLWFYDIRDEAHPKLMTTPAGKPAVFLTEHYVQTYASCTVHYGQQFGKENLLVFAWYTAGTHVVRFTPDYTKTPATVTFEEVAAYLPAGGWTIQAKGLMRNPANPDELIIYTADANRGMDVLIATLPLPDLVETIRGTVKTKVLGVQASRSLPATGVGDPTIILLASMAILLALARGARRSWWSLQDLRHERARSRMTRGR